NPDPVPAPDPSPPRRDLEGRRTAPADTGFFKTNWEVLQIVTRRSLGLSTKAPSIRQAPHMITEGGPIERVAQRTM
ncbi:MAG: hypothetical protein AAFZ06_16045, partial [Pseudomonadota bacterium]